MRKILHIDLNNFYASVECLENPLIKDKIVVVCGDAKNRHGVVLAKNQKAKNLGIKTGMVIWEAKNLAKDLIVINARFHTYLDYSKRIRKIFEDYTDLIEPYGIDESWLDITASIKLLGSAHHIAYTIKERIKNEIGLTVSIGISNNKIYSKLASDIAGIDEILEITQSNYKDIVFPLKVENLLYVGHATGKKLNKLGIFTIGDLATNDIKYLTDYLGKWGEYLHNFANGIDMSSVKSIESINPFKSIGNSLTNYKDIISDHDTMALILILSESVVYRARNLGVKKAKGLSIWIKDSELNSYSFHCQMSPTLLISEISKTAFNLLKEKYHYNTPIRSLGISIFNFVDDNQINFIDYDKLEKQYSLETALFDIKKKYGNSSINRGVVKLDKRIDKLNIIKDHIIHPESYFKK